jgi:cation diffusion facilitator family transporter
VADDATERGGKTMDGCGCADVSTDTRPQRRVLTIALILNVAMFLVGLAAGLVGHSSSLLADALDMLADAAAYGIALVAIGRGARFKANAGMASGAGLLLLGAGVLIDVARRAAAGEHAPEPGLMMAVATLSLIVNSTVLMLLGRIREQGVHLRATWIFARADVIANAAVILSGFIVWLTRWSTLDLLVGCGIGLYVVKEAVELLAKARKAHAAVPR